MCHILDFVLKLKHYTDVRVLNVVHHFFFQSLNWDDLAKKKIKAPIIPEIACELDTSNFSEEFTSMTPAYSPAAVPPNNDKLFKVISASENIHMMNVDSFEKYPSFDEFSWLIPR